MIKVLEVTRESLLEEREHIPARFETDLEEFTARARSFSLVGPEWEAWDRLRDIAFLLHDDKS